MGKVLRGRRSSGARVAVVGRPSLPTADLMKKRRGRILRKSPEQGETSLVDPVFGTIHWEQCRFVAAGMDNEEQKQNEAMVLLAAWFSHSSQMVPAIPVCLLILMLLTRPQLHDEVK
ncbi:uncharacterized protein [Aegilops tauschii subsp. strangulata]|uniref:uncharacterized protein isoform X5 n=1 Tax=Aegilops tauschii subsp. strangulata TaxID=200361 RepID=UPI000989AD07|nr:uncharacterized protein LOC109752917 isoform X4 [Aegilops tauschii subsp. strangulata]